MASLFRNFAVLRLMHSFPFAPIQILTGDTRQGCSSRRGRLHDEGRSLQQKPRIERRFESQVAGRSRLLETWSPCSRPFAILPVSAVSDAQKLATGNFLHVRACFFVTFCTTQKVTIRSLHRENRGSANLDSARRNGGFAQAQLNPFAASRLFRRLAAVLFLLFVKHKK